MVEGGSTTRKARSRSLLLGEKSGEVGGDRERQREPGDGTDRGGGTGERRTPTPTVGGVARMVLLLLRTRRRCGHTAGRW